MLFTCSSLFRFNIYIKLQTILIVEDRKQYKLKYTKQTVVFLRGRGKSVPMVTSM